MKKRKCAVCGTKFTPKVEYTVKVKNESIFDRPIVFDAMDCPACGCQICLQVRECKANEEKPATGEEIKRMREAAKIGVEE